MAVPQVAHAPALIPWAYPVHRLLKKLYIFLFFLHFLLF